jgi:hypothetical protein
MSEDRPPTIEEMRRVAKYMNEIMQLHSAAGKLLAKAAFLENLAQKLIEYKGEDER